MPLPGLSAHAFDTHKTRLTNADVFLDGPSRLLTPCWARPRHSTTRPLRKDQGMVERTTAAGRSSRSGEDYKNPKLSVDQRVDDLLGRMSLAEKAGMLFQTMIVIGSGDLSEPSSTFGIESAEHMINTQALSHFNLVRTAEDARALAEWHNRLQSLAANTRLGIPITLSTDPRHHFTENTGTAATAGAFLPVAGDPRLCRDRLR